MSQDFAQYSGEGNGAGLQTGQWKYSNLDFVCDITAIPAANASYDVILNTEVFEHLPNPIKAIGEFSMLLKPGGLLILTAPFCSLTHFAPFHHSTGFNRYFYEYHLVEAGFQIQELQYNGNFFDFLDQELYRVSSFVKRYCGGYRLNWIQKIVIRMTSVLLRSLSKRDQGSHEALSFGIHVIAKKLA
jgi:SAM-dependent methyltransferase